MNPTRTRILPFLTLAVLAAGLCACGDGRTPGEKLDGAIDATGEKLEEAGEAIQSK